MFVYELIGTYFLLLIIYMNAVNQTKTTDIHGTAIGGYVGLAIQGIGPITGCGLNPMRVLGPAICCGELFESEYGYAYVYYLAPMVAGVLYGISWILIFNLPYKEEAENQMAEMKNDEDNYCEGDCCSLKHIENQLKESGYDKVDNANSRLSKTSIPENDSPKKSERDYEMEEKQIQKAERNAQNLIKESERNVEKEEKQIKKSETKVEKQIKKRDSNVENNVNKIKKSRIKAKKENLEKTVEVNNIDNMQDEGSFVDEECGF